MINANEAAFPTPTRDHPSGETIFGAPGLTKREYFAAMAMQGLIAADDHQNVYCDSRKPLIEAAAEASVRIADALLAELSKNPSPEGAPSSQGETSGDHAEQPSDCSNESPTISGAVR